MDALTDVEIVISAAKDVIDWCDKTGSGDSLYCIVKLRKALENLNTNLAYDDGDYTAGSVGVSDA